MLRIALLLATIAVPLGIEAVEAASPRPCERQPVKKCEIRKHRTCGPITLNFWRDDEGTTHCDRATVQLTATQVIPELRRLRCFLYGSVSDVQFSTKNYRTVEGPRNGDVIRMEQGHAQVTIHGHYDSYNRDSFVTFENQGPGNNVLLKCQGFGPA